MLVIRKESEQSLNEKNKDEQHAYNLMLYVLKNFPDFSLDDQLVIFNKMSFVRTLKTPFLKLRNEVLSDYGNKINQDSVTITDLKADYHISNGMLEMHLDSIEQIDHHLAYYQELFEREKQKVHPDIDNIAKISLVVERLINRRSVLNVGTPIILYFRYQAKKQRLEVQRIKERYAQKTLVLTQQFEDQNKEQKEKENVTDTKKITTDNTNISESVTVTSSNENIDELEHRAKLKDSGNRSIRGNTNRQDNEQMGNEKHRVQSVTNDNSTTAGDSAEDSSSEDYKPAHERRTKEAVF